ncbi:MAG: hypothetical protein JWO57_1387 [Pseudonocardiales bacterium]|nr:hypothetical protein [Pseudonocardiales bacterium]
MTTILLDEAQSPDGAALPLSAWSLHRRVQRNGRTVIEVNDDGGDLVGLITSTSLPMLSVDGAWRGRGYRADGTPQWWALAIGHATASDDEPVVTFTRRRGQRGAPPRRIVVRPSRLQGLWVAAVPGLHTAVTCQQGAEHRIRRLAPVPRLHTHA